MGLYVGNKRVAPVVTIREPIEDLHRCIEFQAPTAENGYTWYRKYADGWVEQGGRGYTNNNNTPRKITLPVQMANANGWYPLIQGRTDQQQDTGAQWQVMPLANSNYPESAQWFWVIGSLGQYRLYFQWHVEGMYATE